MDLTDVFESARLASRALNLVDDDTINSVLMALADETERRIPFILEENSKDLARMDKSNPVYDRLLLTKERIEGRRHSQRG